MRRVRPPAALGVRPAFLVLALTLVLTRGSHAQLIGSRSCAHAKGPIIAELKLPEPASAAAAIDAPSLGIELISPATGEVLESRPAKAGQVDLAALFARLWTTDAPAAVCAQAVLGGKRIGAPLVLVPMLTPRYAARVDRDGTPRIASPGGKPVLSGYWIQPDQRVELTTEKGKLAFALHPEAAPNGVRNFRELVSKGFYDGIPIHRIASISGRARPDILQFGDPTGTGQGGPGYFIDFEPSPLPHGFGTMSYARTSDPNSASSQVFVCLGGGAREGDAGGEATTGSGVAAQLDGKYSVFATLVTGADVLAAIAKSPVDADGRPLQAVRVESARLVDAPPFGEGPKPEKDPFDKPAKR